MDHEWKQDAVVQTGGRIEIDLPELAAGEHVEVVVRSKNGCVNAAAKRAASFGAHRGRIRMGDDFDAPITDFDPYT